MTNLVETQARVILVENVGSFDQLRGRERSFRVQDAVLNVALRGDDDQQDAVFRETQEFDVAEAGGAAWRHHHAREVGQFRKEERCGSDEPLAVVSVELILELLYLRLVERFEREQRINEKPVSARGRDPAGRRVGARNEAHLLEIRHDVADARRTEVEPRKFRQGARPHRLALRDIALDQDLQQNLCSFIQNGGLAHERYSTKNNDQ